MVIVLDYIRAKDTKHHKTRSLVRCELCNSERTLEKSRVNEKTEHICHSCFTKYFFSGNQRKYTIEDYKKLEVTKKIIWVGLKIPQTCGESTKWKCAICQYEWQNRLEALLRKSNCGCPRCFGKHHTPDCEEYHNLAKRGKLIFIGPTPINGSEKTQWKCSKNHIFFSSFQDLKKKKSSILCPECFWADKGNPEDFWLKYPREWAYKVKKRYDFVCQKCGDMDRRNLHAHHVLNRADYPSESRVIENSMCLCQDCHYYFHSEFGHRNNNAKQLLSFLSEKYPLRQIPKKRCLTKVWLDYYFC